MLKHQERNNLKIKHGSRCCMHAHAHTHRAYSYIISKWGNQHLVTLSLHGIKMSSRGCKGAPGMRPCNGMRCSKTCGRSSTTMAGTCQVKFFRWGGTHKGFSIWSWFAKVVQTRVFASETTFSSYCGLGTSYILGHSLMPCGRLCGKPVHLLLLSASATFGKTCHSVT